MIRLISQFYFLFSPTFSSGYPDTKIHVLSDNSGYFVIQLYSTQTPRVMRYLFSSSTNQQYALTGMYNVAYGTLLISNTELFWITRINTSPLNAVFIKLTFMNLSSDWAKQMSCTSGWVISYSESLLSADKSKIYSLFAYSQSSVYNIYFYVFNSSDGSNLGNRYQSSAWTGTSSVYGSFMSGDKIVATLVCSNQYFLVIYSISDDTFTFKLFTTGLNLYGCAIETGSGR